jgi:prophage regulatory protein
MNPSFSNYNRALRLREVADRTGLSKTHIYRLIQRGQFPTPARLSERVVAWDEAAVNAWLSERFAAAGGTHA